MPIFALTPSISAQRRMAMYRGVRPMFADRALRLNLADGSPVALWTTDPDGCTGMDARATLA